MDLPINQILVGDCVAIMNRLPAESVDLIFADPPYNLQLQKELYRPDMSKVSPVDDDWDQFDSFSAYDNFSRAWLSACQRVLKPSGTIWVIGSYHNIFRIGATMQNLGFWILNDVVWVKTNPMPNFHGVRFTNANETLIWASTSQQARYTFHHQALKAFNEDKQMRSDWWLIPLAKGKERLRDETGKRAHSTQKPEALLYRVIMGTTHPGDVILDPFFGSGTTGAVAKTLHRKWIGIEQNESYAAMAQQRIDAVPVTPYNPEIFDVRSIRRKHGRVSFAVLVENGLFTPGQTLYFRKDKSRSARIKPDAKLRVSDGYEGTIHLAARHFMDGKPCNGWDHWYFEQDGEMFKIDVIRQQYWTQRRDESAGDS